MDGDGSQNLYSVASVASRYVKSLLVSFRSPTDRDELRIQTEPPFSSMMDVNRLVLTRSLTLPHLGEKSLSCAKLLT